MSRFKVVVTDCEFGEVSIEEEVLKQIGFVPLLAQCRTEEEVIEAARDADGLLN